MRAGGARGAPRPQRGRRRRGSAPTARRCRWTRGALSRAPRWSPSRARSSSVTISQSTPTATGIRIPRLPRLQRLRPRPGSPCSTPGRSRGRRGGRWARGPRPRRSGTLRGGSPTPGCSPPASPPGTPRRSRARAPTALSPPPAPRPPRRMPRRGRTRPRRGAWRRERARGRPGRVCPSARPSKPRETGRGTAPPPPHRACQHSLEDTARRAPWAAPARGPPCASRWSRTPTRRAFQARSHVGSPRFASRGGGDMARARTCLWRRWRTWRTRTCLSSPPDNAATSGTRLALLRPPASADEAALS
mmetsp:Transcript_11005/g.34958  ORF Transcript_11005/g.34958 Transcript_11005/m.34958 type:complete len:304 (+) Transcript_11005:166-1077(+)